MRARFLLGLCAVAFAGLVAAGIFAAQWLEERNPEPSAPDIAVSPELVARGEYLTRAADCEACHTVPGGEPFAGGRPFRLPFGTLYSTNVTADRDTGIGTWRDRDFVRALHRGIAKNGDHLYPAFPYSSYTAMTQEDALAIKAYLFSLPTVHAPARRNHLEFPFNQRWGLAFWNLAFLDQRRFSPDHQLNVAQNRGRYLATALGHCGECHTPRTIAYSMNMHRAFAGAEVDGWHAYNITSAEQFGLGDWTDRQIFAYLNSGHATGHGTAGGPMGEVVSLSLRYLTPEDVTALVSYLRTIKPQQGLTADVENGPQRGAPNMVAGTGRRAVETDLVGRTLFSGACSGCHNLEGGGRQSSFADLTGSRTVADPAAHNILRVLLDGADQRSLHPALYMPSFASAYSDEELAALTNFVVKQFSGRDGRVRSDDVHSSRAETAP